MLSLPIVVRLDVLKDTGLSRVSAYVSVSVYQLNFERMEKAFHCGVVVTGGFAPHAATQAIDYE
jgi:hypothetical protein